jgi:zinc D-Ala-D-Ala carboxypeptidase
VGDMTKNFSRHEFACRCGCGYDDVDRTLVDRLQRARTSHGPITVTSGCRCRSHNTAEGGSPTSSHILGLAVDVKVAGGEERFEILTCLIEAGFRRIGVASSFIHADIDPDKQEPSLFTYDRPHAP